MKQSAIYKFFGVLNSFLQSNLSKPSRKALMPNLCFKIKDRIDVNQQKGKVYKVKKL